MISDRLLVITVFPTTDMQLLKVAYDQAEGDIDAAAGVLQSLVPLIWTYLGVFHTHIWSDVARQS